MEMKTEKKKEFNYEQREQVREIVQRMIWNCTVGTIKWAAYLFVAFVVGFCFLVGFGIVMPNYPQVTVAFLMVVIVICISRLGVNDL